MLAAPQGLVLITGPTGSGKTSTLYAALREIHTPERNIVTLEDPVEVQLPGITQVQVHERAGMTFARGLRAVLRQDPDVVLVGEVRDAETAELALRASLTGHLVLTTLHTNDSVSALTRLVDMGVEPFLVASSLSLVIAQRLVRRPCPSCAAAGGAGPGHAGRSGPRPLAVAGGHFVRGAGCADCGETGYRGRVGVFEVLRVTPTSHARCSPTRPRRRSRGRGRPDAPCAAPPSRWRGRAARRCARSCAPPRSATPTTGVPVLRSRPRADHARVSRGAVRPCTPSAAAPAASTCRRAGRSAPGARPTPERPTPPAADAFLAP